MARVTITVPRHDSSLPDVLDKIFDPSEHIAEAEAKFWDMHLAHTARLGRVLTYKDRYEVEFVYRERRSK